MWHPRSHRIHMLHDCAVSFANEGTPGHGSNVDRFFISTLDRRLVKLELVYTTVAHRRKGNLLLQHTKMVLDDTYLTSKEDQRCLIPDSSIININRPVEQIFLPIGVLFGKTEIDRGDQKDSKFQLPTQQDFCRLIIQR